jgi:hypothetical protein
MSIRSVGEEMGEGYCFGREKNRVYFVKLRPQHLNPDGGSNKIIWRFLDQLTATTAVRRIPILLNATGETAADKMDEEADISFILIPNNIAIATIMIMSVNF